MNFCPYCGTKTIAGASFCASCGARISGQAMPPMSAAAPTPPMPPAPPAPPAPPVYQAPYSSPEAECEPKRVNSLAIVGMILGILSASGLVFLGVELSTSFSVIVILIILSLLGVPAIILSIIALKKRGGKGMAISGLITGVVGICPLLIPLLILLYFIFILIMVSGLAQGIVTLL